MIDFKSKLLNAGIVRENEYLDKYVDLISANTSNNKERFITQTHHIIPQYYYKHEGVKCDNSKRNTVELTYSDHLLAHYYLMRCASNEVHELANANAIFKNLNNPHSNNLEKWIKTNQKLLDTINRRRCELISLHHADVSGDNNPRATKVYEYNEEGRCIQIFDTIRIFATSINMNSDSVRSLLSHNKIYVNNGRMFSKDCNILKDDIIKIIQYKDNLNYHKRRYYEFVCDTCGTKYRRLWSDYSVEKYKNSRRICTSCATTGNMFIGRKHTDTHKSRIAKARTGQKWVHNEFEELQVNEKDLSSYLESGYVIGQFPKITIIKDGKTSSISKKNLQKYLESGWNIYEKRTSN